MLQKVIKVSDEAGIHARPAGIIAKRAMKYKSKIAIIHKNEEYDAKSVISVMTMTADGGDELIIRTDGPDEAEAIGEMVNLILNELRGT